MILYLDSSAIVKQYVPENGSAEVRDAVKNAEVVGTVAISHAEGEAAVRSFNKNWHDLIRTRVTDRLVKHASDLAWNHDLRGYDSVQLASAAAWQQAVGRPVTLATFDFRLWNAAQQVGLLALPEHL